MSSRSSLFADLYYEVLFHFFFIFIFLLPSIRLHRIWKEDNIVNMVQWFQLSFSHTKYVFPPSRKRLLSFQVFSLYSKVKLLRNYDSLMCFYYQSKKGLVNNPAPTESLEAYSAVGSNTDNSQTLRVPHGSRPDRKSVG